MHSNSALRDETSIFLKYSNFMGCSWAVQNSGISLADDWSALLMTLTHDFRTLMRTSNGNFTFVSSFL